MIDLIESFNSEEEEKMDNKNLWLILTIIAFITFLASIFMSYKTGKTEYAWIIGSMLFGIGCGDKYSKVKNK